MQYYHSDVTHPGVTHEEIEVRRMEVVVGGGGGGGWKKGEGG